MTKKIKAFQAGDNHITFSSLISQVMIGRNNKATYLTLVLQDDSGTIDAKLWNAKPEQVESLKMGCVVEVTGDVIRYGEELQLKIEKIDIVSTDPEMADLPKALFAAHTSIGKIWIIVLFNRSQYFYGFLLFLCHTPFPVSVCRDIP